MRIYGLTGGIASGKSEVRRRFEELGIATIDADLIGHEVIAPEGVAAKDVAAAFGEDILTCGKIDRDKLGALIFGDEKARKRLNQIVHPAIGLEIATRCQALAESGHSRAIVEAALLGENSKSGSTSDWAGLILVLCSKAERLRRLMATRGLELEEAQRRIDAQVAPESKSDSATWIIHNEGDLDSLFAQVDTIAEKL